MFVDGPDENLPEFFDTDRVSKVEGDRCHWCSEPLKTLKRNKKNCKSCGRPVCDKCS